MSRAIEPRNTLTVGAAAFRSASAALERRNWLGASRPAGVKEQGAFISGSIQEPGRPVRFHPKSPAGDTGIKAPGPRARACARRERNNQALRWYCQAKATKRGGMNAWDSE